MTTSRNTGAIFCQSVPGDTSSTAIRAWTESTTLTTRSMPSWPSATTGLRRGLRTSRTCSREMSEGASADRQRPWQAPGAAAGNAPGYAEVRRCAAARGMGHLAFVRCRRATGCYVTAAQRLQPKRLTPPRPSSPSTARQVQTVAGRCQVRTQSERLESLTAHGGMIRLRASADLTAAASVYRRASLCNASDRDNLLAHPEYLILGPEGLAEGRRHCEALAGPRVAWLRG